MMKRILYIISMVLLLAGSTPAFAQVDATLPLSGFSVTDAGVSFQYDHALPLSSVKTYGKDGNALQQGFIPVGGDQIVADKADDMYVTAFIGAVYGDVSTHDAALGNDATYFDVHLQNGTVVEESIVHDLESYHLNDDGIVNFALSADITNSPSCQEGSKLSCYQGLSTQGLINDNNGIDTGQLGILEGTNSTGGGNLLFLVTNIVNSIFLLLGFVAVILIIIEGILLILSRGDEDRRKKIGSTILNIGIGFAVILMSYAIVVTILNVLGGNRTQRNDNQVATVQELEQDTGVGLLRGSATGINPETDYVQYKRPDLQYKTDYQKISDRVTDYVSDYRPLDGMQILADDLTYSVKRGSALDVLKSEWQDIKSKRFGVFVTGATDTKEKITVWVSDTYNQVKSSFAKEITGKNGTNPTTKAEGIYYDLSDLSYKDGVANPNIINIQTSDGQISYFALVIRKEGEEQAGVYIPGRTFADYASLFTGKISSWADGLLSSSYNKEALYFDVKKQGETDSRTFSTGGTVQLNPSQIQRDEDVTITLDDHNRIEDTPFTKVVHELKRSDGEIIAMEAANGTSFTIKVPDGGSVRIVDDIAGVTSTGQVVDLGTDSLELLNNATLGLYQQSALANVELQGQIPEDAGSQTVRVFPGDFITLPKVGDTAATLAMQLKYYSKATPNLIEFTSQGIKDGVVRYVDGEVTASTDPADTKGGVVPYTVSPDLVFDKEGTYSVQVTIEDYYISRTLAKLQFTVQVVGDGTKIAVSPSVSGVVGTSYNISTRPTFSENKGLSTKRVEIATLEDDGSTQLVTSRALTQGNDSFDYVPEKAGVYVFTVINTFSSGATTKVSTTRTVLPEAPSVSFEIYQEAEGGNVYTIVDRSTNVSTDNIYVTTSPYDPGLQQTAWVEDGGIRKKTLTFSKAGNYKVFVTARGDYGETSSDSKLVTVSNNVQQATKIFDQGGTKEIQTSNTETAFTVSITGKNIAKVDIKDGPNSLATLQGGSADTQQLTQSLQLREAGAHLLSFEFYGKDAPNTLALRVTKTMTIFSKDTPQAGINVFQGSTLLYPKSNVCAVAGVQREGYVVHNDESYQIDASASTNVFGQAINASTNNLSYLWKIGGTQVSNSSFRISQRFNTVTDASSCVPVELSLTESVNGEPKVSKNVIYVLVENRLPTYQSFIPSYPQGILKTPFSLPVKFVGLQDPDTPSTPVEVTWFYEIDGKRLGSEVSSTTDRTLYVKDYGVTGETYNMKVGAEIKDTTTGESRVVYAGERQITIGEAQTVGIEIKQPTLSNGFEYIPWSVDTSRSIAFSANAALSNGDVISAPISWTVQRVGRFQGCTSSIESLPRSFGNNNQGTANTTFDQCGLYKVRAKVSYLGQEATDTLQIKVYASQNDMSAEERSLLGSLTALHGSAPQVVGSSELPGASFFLKDNTNTVTGKVSEVIPQLESLSFARSAILSMLSDADSVIRDYINSDKGSSYQKLRDEIVASYGDKEITVALDKPTTVFAGDGYSQLLSQGFTPAQAVSKTGYSAASDTVTYTPDTSANGTETTQILKELGAPADVTADNGYNPTKPVNGSFYWAYDFYSSLGLPSQTIYDNIQQYSLDFGSVYSNIGTPEQLHTQYSRGDPSTVVPVSFAKPVVVTRQQAQDVYASQGIPQAKVDAIIADHEQESGSVLISALEPVSFAPRELFDVLLAQGFTKEGAVRKIATDNPMLGDIKNISDITADSVYYRAQGTVELPIKDYVDMLTRMGFSKQYIEKKYLLDNDGSLESALSSQSSTAQYRPSTPVVLSLSEYFSELQRLGLPSSVIYKKLVTDNPELATTYSKIDAGSHNFVERYDFLQSDKHSDSLRLFPRKPVTITGEELLAYARNRFPLDSLMVTYIGNYDDQVKQDASRLLSLTSNERYVQLQQLLASKSIDLSLYEPIQVEVGTVVQEAVLEGFHKEDILAMLKQTTAMYDSTQGGDLSPDDTTLITLPQGAGILLATDDVKKNVTIRTMHPEIAQYLLDSSVERDDKVQEAILLPLTGTGEMFVARMLEEGYTSSDVTSAYADIYPEVATILQGHDKASISTALAAAPMLQRLQMETAFYTGTKKQLIATFIRKGINLDGILSIFESISPQLTFTAQRQNGLNAAEILLSESNDDTMYMLPAYINMTGDKVINILGGEGLQRDEILSYLGMNTDASQNSDLATSTVALDLSPEIFLGKERSMQLLALHGVPSQLQALYEQGAEVYKAWSGLALQDASWYPQNADNIYYPGGISLQKDGSEYGEEGMFAKQILPLGQVSSEQLSQNYPVVYNGGNPSSGFTVLSFPKESDQGQLMAVLKTFDVSKSVSEGILALFDLDLFKGISFDRILHLPNNYLANLSNVMLQGKHSYGEMQEFVLTGTQKEIADTQSLKNAISTVETLHSSADGANILPGYGVLDETALFDCKRLGLVEQQSGARQLVCNDGEVYLSSPRVILQRLGDNQATLKKELSDIIDLFETMTDVADKERGMTQLYEAVDKADLDAQTKEEIYHTLPFVLIQDKVQLHDLLSSGVAQVKESIMKAFDFSSTVNAAHIKDLISKLQSLDATDIKGTLQGLITILKDDDATLESNFSQVSILRPLESALMDRGGLKKEDINGLHQVASVQEYIQSLLSSISATQVVFNDVEKNAMTDYLTKGINNLVSVETELEQARVQGASQANDLLHSSLMPELYVDGTRDILKAYNNDSTVQKADKEQHLATVSERIKNIIDSITTALPNIDIAQETKTGYETKLKEISGYESVDLQLESISTLLHEIRVEHEGNENIAALELYGEVSREIISAIREIRSDARLTYTTPQLRGEVKDALTNTDATLQNTILDGYRTSILPGYMTQLSELLNKNGFGDVATSFAQQVHPESIRTVNDLDSFHGAIAKLFSDLKDANLLNETTEYTLASSLQSLYLREFAQIVGATGQLTSGSDVYRSQVSDLLDKLAQTASVGEAGEALVDMEKSIMSSSLLQSSKKEILAQLLATLPLNDLTQAQVNCAPVYVKDETKGVQRMCVEDKARLAQHEVVSSTQLQALILTYLDQASLPNDVDTHLQQLVEGNLNYADIREYLKGIDASQDVASYFYKIPVVGDEWYYYQLEQLTPGVFGSQEEIMRAIMVYLRDASTRVKAVVRESLLQIADPESDQGMRQRDLYIVDKIIQGSDLSQEIKAKTKELVDQLGTIPETADVTLLSPVMSLSYLEEAANAVASTTSRDAIAQDITRLKDALGKESALAVSGYASDIEQNVLQSTNLSSDEKQQLAFNARTIAEYEAYVAELLPTTQPVTETNVNVNTNIQTNENTAVPATNTSGDTPFLITVFWWFFTAFLVIMLCGVLIGAVLYIMFLQYRKKNKDVHVDFEEFILIVRNRLSHFFGDPDPDQEPEEIVHADPFAGLPVKPDDPLPQEDEQREKETPVEEVSNATTLLDTQEKPEELAQRTVETESSAPVVSASENPSTNPVAPSHLQGPAWLHEQEEETPTYEGYNPFVEDEPKPNTNVPQNPEGASSPDLHGENGPIESKPDNTTSQK